MFHNWLKPIDDKETGYEKLSDWQFGKKIQVFREEIPDLKKTAIAIIGIGEQDANAVRKQLYALSFPFNSLAIADLGNLRKTENSFIIPLVKELLDSNIFPVLIGSEVKFAFSQYKAFHESRRQINLVVVDENIPFDPDNNGSNAELYLKDVLDTKNSNLFNFGIIGCQSHFCAPDTFKFLEKRNFDCIRLGSARNNLQDVEPVIRDGDLLSFNISALKQLEAPAQSKGTPNGFYTEEACKICHYAGMSDKMKSFGIFGFKEALDREALTAQSMAQMIWYLIDGYYKRKGDYPVTTDNLMEYIVDFKTPDYHITFWKSKNSGRWWMQIPAKTQKNLHRHHLVPCSYNDYLQASKEELPERLLMALRRFS